MPTKRGTNTEKDDVPSREAGPSKKIQVTYLVPRNLGKNLSVYCSVTGQSKTEVVTDVLTKFLISKHYKPDKEPRIHYSD